MSEFPVGDIPCAERKRIVEIVNSESGLVAMKQLMPMEHDWRLYERVVANPAAPPIETRWNETWYCIRCRHIETRTR